MSDAYTLPVRRLGAKVEMGFYENSADDDAEVGVSPAYSASHPNRWIQENRNQLISVSLAPKHRYALLDGYTKLNGLSRLAEISPDTIIPIYAGLCGADGYFTGAKPTYDLEYALPRKVNQVMLVGDETWGQYPTEYRIILTVTDGETDGETAETVSVPDYQTIEKQVEDVGGGRKTVTVTAADGANSVRQLVAFDRAYQVKGLTLEISRWSAGGTCAKMMYFSNDMKITMDESKIASLTVLEEKSTSVDKLSYGITSNSCTVQVSNADGRFFRNRDLLKKNRILRPFIGVESGANMEYTPMGKFFSDDWQISSTSSFITCKAYDILYNLQNMKLYYEMERGADGSYLLDGSVNGRNGNAKAVFEKIFRLINRQKRASGIYGTDLEFDVDERLAGIDMPYVLIGCDTAWNILQDMANFAMSYIYVDRDGRVLVRRDDFANEARLESQNSGVSINPCNSFTYNLPTMSRTIVNRVTVPYVMFGKSDEVEKFIVERDDFEYDEDGNIVVNIQLKKVRKKINNIQYIQWTPNSQATEPIEIKTSCTDCRFVFVGDAAITSIEIEFFGVLSLGEIVVSKHVGDDNVSQKQNGIVEYEHKPNNLIFGKETAVATANKLLQEYANGKQYIETDWQGTTALKIGDEFESHTVKFADRMNYECLSNEFDFSGGLKVKTKARQK